MFRIFKISREVRILKQSQCALFCCITHTAILFVFTCVMNVRDQTRQTFVTDFGPFCSLTIEYRAFQFVPSFNILEQFESILVTIFQQISFLPFRSGGHRYMKKTLCGVVESSCLPTHNIDPHTSLNDPPCHVTTTKKHENFEGMVISLPPSPPAEIRDSNMVLQLSTIPVLNSHCLRGQSQVYMIKERCWFFQIDFFVKYFTHRIQQILCRPHEQMRTTLVDGLRTQLETFFPTVLQQDHSNSLSQNSPAKR